VFGAKGGKSLVERVVHRVKWAWLDKEKQVMARMAEVQHFGCGEMMEELER
jgi:hypothetical protein